MRSIVEKLKRKRRDMKEADEKAIEGGFQDAGDDGSFRVSRRDDRGRLAMLGIVTSSEAGDPDALIGYIQDKHGGGRYYVLPTRDGKKAGKGFSLELDGQPKKARRRSASAEDDGGVRPVGLAGKVKDLEERLAQKDREQEQRELNQRLDRIEKMLDDGGKPDVMSAILANFPAVIEGMSGFRQKESPSDTLEKLSVVWKNLEGTRPRDIDPTEMITRVVDLVFRIGDQMKPPVSTSGPANQRGTGFGAFLSGVLNELERRYAGRLFGGGPGIQEGGRPSLAEATPASAGLSGLPAGEAGAGGRGFDPALLSFQALGIDPFARIRAMIAQRADPEQIADTLISVVDFAAAFSEQGSVVQRYVMLFFNDPGGGFDSIAAFVPEIAGAGAEYIARLRTAIVAAAHRYVSDFQQQAQAGAGWPQQGPERATPAQEGTSAEQPEAEPEREDRPGQEPAEQTEPARQPQPAEA